MRAAAGVYSPLTLTALDSGVRYEGQGAVISGGALLPPGIIVPPTDPIFSRLSAATRAVTRRFDISDLINASGSDAVSGKFQLSCDGQAMNLASWPSNGSWAHTGTAVGPNGFAYPADAPLSSKATEGLWIEGYFIYDWSDSRMPVTSIDQSNVTLFADTSAAHYVSSNGHFNADARFWFLNLPEFLQQPGQYWLDTATSMVYVVLASSDAATSRGTCTLAVTPTVLEVRDTSHISFTGFSIAAAQETLVTVSNSSFIEISNCSVHTGLAGIAVSGGAHVAITDVEVMSVGSTAVSIAGGDRASLVAGSHSVTNCTIHDYAKVIWCYHPGVKIAGVGHTGEWSL